jgi:disulfide bond formation protein DsbB
MNINKRFIIMIIIALLAYTLAACGGGNDATNTGGNSDPAGESSGETIATGDPVAGEEMYNQVCIACHGPGGAGIENLGKDMTTSEFIADSTDAEMLAFVKTGRPVGHPDNTTGVDMPPKGGNPALTDEQIMDIIAYIRTLQS